MKILLLLFGLVAASTAATSSLVLHDNGALVPRDTPEVAEARRLHLESVEKTLTENEEEETGDEEEEMTNEEENEEDEESKLLFFRPW